MSFNPLAFTRGLLEGAAEVKEKETEQRNKVIEQLQKARLKAVETQMEAYNKRKTTFQQVQSAMDSGDYNSALMYAVKESGLDPKVIGKEINADDEEGVKAYLDGYRKDFYSVPEPNYEQELMDTYKYTEKSRGLISNTFKNFLGLDNDEGVVYSSVKANRPDPFEGSKEDLKSGPLPLRKAGDDKKPNTYSDTVEIGGESLPRVTSFKFDGQGRPVIIGSAMGASRGPAKVAPQLNKQDMTSINGMLDSRIKELKMFGDEGAARMLDESIGGKKGKTGKPGDLQYVWKQTADELRKDQSVDPIEAYQVATQELEEMWRLGFIEEKQNYFGFGKSDYTFVDRQKKIQILEDMYNNKQINDEQLDMLINKYLTGG